MIQLTQDKAKAIVKGMGELRCKLQSDEKANPVYWSGGDSWCSGSDIDAAADWVNTQLAAYLMKQLGVTEVKHAAGTRKRKS